MLVGKYLKYLNQIPRIVERAKLLIFERAGEFKLEKVGYRFGNELTNFTDIGIGPTDVTEELDIHIHVERLIPEAERSRRLDLGKSSIDAQGVESDEVILVSEVAAHGVELK